MNLVLESVAGMKDGKKTEKVIRFVGNVRLLYRDGIKSSDSSGHTPALKYQTYFCAV